MSYPGPYGGPNQGQTPPNPPGGYNPYGAPPPPGYGQYPPRQPPQYPQQYPPQQYPPGPPTPGGGFTPPPRKPRLWIPALVVGLVVVLTGGGTAAWFLMARGGEEAAKTTLAGKVAWKTPEPSPTAKVEPLGSWSAAGVVVQVTTRGITAWSQSSGVKKWEIAPPDPPGRSEGYFCGAGSSAVKGLGVVSYGTKEASEKYGTCSGIMLLDLGTGQPRWKFHIATGDFPIDRDYIHVDIAGNRVVYAFEDKVFALGVNSGNKVWTYDKPDCWMRDYKVGNEAVVVAQECEDENMSMLMLDPANGKVTSSAQLPTDTFVDVVSADPAVLSVRASDISNPAGNYVVFDEKGNKRASISQQFGSSGLDTQAINMATSTEHAQYRVLVSHGMLVTVTDARRSGSVRYTNEIVAFDLDTGKLRWSKSLGPDITGVPFAATENGVLAINGGTREKPSKVVRLSWGDGTIKPLSKPYSSLGVVLVEVCALHWEGDAVYAVNMSGNDVAPKAFALK